jgi:hypothetical protein
MLLVTEVQWKYFPKTEKVRICIYYTNLLFFFFQFPRTEEKWKQIASNFEKRWNFPYCLGAVDGKHIEIVLPPGSGSYFF